MLEGLAQAYRVKIVNQEEPSRWGWLLNWHDEHPNYIELGDVGPIEVSYIEWLEVQPLQAEEIEKRLQLLSIPYEWQDTFLRITGYIR